MPFSIRAYYTRRFSKLSSTYFLICWSFFALLVMFVGEVYAEWVLVEPSNDGVAVYVDPNTIRRKGDRVMVWFLFDFKTVKTVGSISFLSYKQQREFDCAEELTREIASTDFSDNMGRGKVVARNSNEDRWRPVQPNSVGRALWKAACSKK